MEEWKQIQDLLDKIRGVGTGGISSDDEHAIEKLEAKLKSLIEYQQLMKDVNAHYRKHGNLDEFNGLTEQEKAKLMANMQSSWHVDKSSPFMSYQLTNNNAEIKRIQQRIADLKKREVQEYPEWEFTGGHVKINKGANRIQIFFDGKPAEDVITQLKSSAFKWSPKAGAWQRQLTDNAYRSMDRIDAIQPDTGEKPSAMLRKAKAEQARKDAEAAEIEANAEAQAVAAEQVQTELVEEQLEAEKQITGEMQKQEIIAESVSTRKHKLARTINGKSGKFKFEKPEPATYHEMTRDRATGYIAKHNDYNVWENWYSRALDPFRTQIAETLENDIRLRNAALNQMWDEYKRITGEDISYSDFLDKKVHLYRGEQTDSQSESEKALSFSLIRQTAEEFGEHVLEIVMRPRDTLGMARPTYVPQPEAEVMVPKSAVPEYDQWRRGLITNPVEEIDTDSVKTETDELVEQYNRILSTVREWQELYQKLRTLSGGSTKEIRENVLSVIKNISPELVSMIGGQFAENFANGFKGVKTKDILTAISYVTRADLLGSVTDQMNMLSSIDLNNFDMSSLPINETHITFLKEAFAILEKISAKKKEIASTDAPIMVSDASDDVVEESVDSTIAKVQEEAEALEDVSTSAQQASQSKIEFTDANAKVAESEQKSVDGAEEEAEAFEEVGQAAQTAQNMIKNADNEVGTLSFSTRNPEELYAQMSAFAENRKAENNYDLSRVSVNTDGHGNPLGATISYYKKATKETIVETFRLDKAAKEADDSVNRLVLVSRKATAGFSDLEKAMMGAISKQDTLMAQKNKTISTLSGAVDPNANRTLFGTQYEQEARGKIQAVRDEVAKLDHQVNGVLSEEEFLTIKRRIAELVQEASDFITQSKNAEYAPTQLESHSVSSGNKYRQDQLAAYINEWKRAGIYVGDLKDKAEELMTSVVSITNHEDLKKYLEGLKEARALAKLATQDKKAENDEHKKYVDLIRERVKLQSQIDALDSDLNRDELAALRAKQADIDTKIKNSKTNTVFTPNDVAKIEEEARRELSVAEGRASDKMRTHTQTEVEKYEKAIMTLPSRLEEIKRKLSSLGDIDGADAIADVLRAINEEYQRFLTSTQSEEKIELFRSITSSMGWVNSELRNLSGQSAEIKKQETEVAKAELEKQKAEREAYVSWWKSSLDEQDEVDAYEKSLLDRERKEKEKDEKVIAARKKKEEAYEAWWQKSLFERERAPYLKYGKTTADATVRKRDSMHGAIDSLGVTNPEVLDKIDAYNAKVQEVIRLREKFSKDPEAAKDASLTRQFQKSSQEAEKLRRNIKSIIDEEEKMIQMSDEQGFVPVELTSDQLSNLQDVMVRHAESTAQGKFELKGWNDEQNKMYYTVTESNGAVHEMTLALGQGTNKLYQMRTATKETGTLMQQIFKGIKVKAKELLSFVIGGGSVYKIIAMIRQGIQYIKDVDKALTELRKVTNETDETYAKFLNTASKTGQKLGTTISQVTLATATFAKLGYAMNEASEMAQSALVYKNVGDGISSAEDAADSIISTLKGFNLEASESMRIVDRFNEIGNKFAITSKGIGDALQLSASALAEGGNSLDESIALITGANEVVNDPNSVGTALKTLTLRLRGAKTELNDAGLDIENMANTTSQLQAKLLALTGGQVDIMLDANTFKNSTQILREMADAWEYMTDVQRASALELMGGKRQANVLSALIQNFDTVESVIKTSEGSAGSALRENEVFLDSIEGKLQQLQNTVQAKWTEALDTDVIKDAIHLLTQLVGTLDFKDSALVDLVGDLIKALSWLVDLVGDNNFGYTLIAFFSAKSINKYGWPKFFDKFKKQGQETVESLEKNIEQLNNKMARRQKDLKGKGFTDEQIKADPKIKQWSEEVEDCKDKIAQYNEKVKEADDTLADVSKATDSATDAASAHASTVAADSAATSTNSGQQDVNNGAQNANSDARMVNDTTIDEQNRDISTQNGLLDQNSAKQTQNATVNKKSASSLAGGFKSLLKGLATMIAIQYTMQAIDGIINLIKGAGEDVADTFEEIHDEFERESDALQQEKSELKDIESELKDVESQIVEIKSLGELSFTKQEELNNLQKQKEELERIAEIQGIISQNQQKKTNNAALAAAQSYMKQAASVDESREEYIEKESEKITQWTDTIGDTLMAAGAVMAMIPAIGWVAGGITAGIGLLTKIGGKHAADAYAENKYDKQQTNQEAINSYAKKREEYQKKLDDAFAKGDAEEYNKIKEEYEKFEVMMSDNIGSLIEYLNSVDYKTLSDTKKKEFEAFQRIVNQYSLQNGGSLANVINSILQYDRYQKTGYDMKSVQNQLKKGNITEEEARAQIESLITPELLAEFTTLDPNISTDDIVNSYVQLGVDALNNASLVDSLDKVSKVTNAFDALGNAVKEFREEGRVAAGTLESLNETFGGLDEFEDLYQVLATGEGDLESAITGVANAYVGQAGILTDMTDEELSIMSSRLSALGVLNAEEVIMARKTGQEKLDAHLSSAKATYSIDLSMYGTAEQAKLAIAQAAGLNIAEIHGDTIEELEKTYGKDLSAYATVEEAKIAIAQERAVAEADADRAKLKRDYNAGKITESEYLSGLESIDSSINFANNSSVIQSIIDNAYKGFEFNFNGQTGIGSSFDETPEEKAVREANEAYQKEMKYWENRIAANQAKYEQLQNEIDLLEAKGQKADASFYEGQMTLEEDRLFLLQQQKAAALAHLSTLEEGSEEWWEVANTLNGLEGEIDSVTASIVDLQDAIGEINTYKFEEFGSRLDNLVSKLDTISNLIAPDGADDWFDDEGNWTNKGVAVLGKEVQALELYKKGLTETNDELEKYSQAYSNNTKAYYESLGIHSEQEWYDKTEELISQQYDFAESISDTEQSIVDMYESNIDAVEEYTQTLIDSYNDYIDGVKEALDAERDLYDFKKNVQKQSKDIASLERRIASLSGSSNASDIAERRKLEAQLYESRESLSDTYYDHAKNAQSAALDAEASAYEESMNRMVEGMRTSLEQATMDMDTFLSNVTSLVSLNAGAILTEYQNTGLELDPALTTPWVNAKNAVGDYSGNALALMDDWSKNGFLTTFSENVAGSLTSPWSAGTAAADSFKAGVSTVMANVVSNIATNVKTASGELSNLYKQIQDTERKAADASVTVGNTTASGGGEKKYYVTKTLLINGTQLSVTKSNTDANQAKSDATLAITQAYENYQKQRGKDQEEYSQLWLKNYKSKVRTVTDYYAKGTTGVDQDKFAIVDELGPELILHADPTTGRLQYLTKGSGVVPADLTTNLMEWGQFTPDSLNLGNGVNVNMINNAVNKPEFNFAFDALVKAENITEETLPAVKKLVTQELNRFTKELNYALKGKGAR